MSRTHVILVLAGLAACRGETVRTAEFTAVREVEREVQLGVSTVERYGARAAHAQPEPQAEALLAWDTPAGWVEQPGNQIRLGSFAVPGGGDCSISKTRGGLLLNVNRWRQQFGLAEIDGAAAEALPHARVGNGGDARLVELEGTYTGMGDTRIEDAKLLGLIAPITDDLSLFVKLVGPRAAVDAARPSLLALGASLRAADGGSADHGAADGHAAETAPRWTLPDTWAVVPGQRAMRLVTVAPEGKDVECWVTALPGRAGDLEMNVNRWLGEVGAAKLDAAGIAALPTLRMLGTDATLVEAYGDYAGKDRTRAASGLLGAICMRPGDAVFVKMVGDADTVRAEKTRFLEFAGSLRL